MFVYATKHNIEMQGTLSEMCQNPAYNEYARKPEKPEKSLKHSKTLNSNQTTDDQ